MEKLILKLPNLSDAGARLVSSLTNLGMFWKLALIALMIPVAALSIAGAALNNTDRLKYEYDNLYGFMLIPIIALDEGNLHAETLSAT